jgi:hypothetical protein
LLAVVDQMVEVALRLVAVCGFAEDRSCRIDLRAVPVKVEDGSLPASSARKSPLGEHPEILAQDLADR